MIHQFVDLGHFYMNRECVSADEVGQLALYGQDPAQKFRTQTILLLLFSSDRFVRVQVEQYDASKKLWYLYRGGPPNTSDATPTFRIPVITKGNVTEFADAVRKALRRLSRSTSEAIKKGRNLPQWETEALPIIRDGLDRAAEQIDPGSAEKMIGEQGSPLAMIAKDHLPNSKEAAILSVAWRDNAGALKRVGDFTAFQQALIRSGEQSASTKKGIEREVVGRGQCCICGKRDTKVSGLLQIPQFKLYTLDKLGSVSSGFDRSTAWRNFPACRECCQRVDFAGERVKKELSFDYYGFKYLFLPLAVQSKPTLAYKLLERLVDARVNKRAKERLTAAEDEIFYVVSEFENNRLQVDLVFYQPDPQSFRPALYVSGLLPMRFQKLFETKDRADAHPWFRAPSPRSFTRGRFTFGSFRKIFPAAHGGSRFNDDFLAATRAAFELRPFPASRLLQAGMRWVRRDYLETKSAKSWQDRLAELLRSILFFEELTGYPTEGKENAMQIDYGGSDQADRVRKVLGQASGKLRTDPPAQAAFLVGACCSRIETIQEHQRGAAPFGGKLKGFRLNQADIQRLFVAAKDKAKAYGPDEERKVTGLLECAAAALTASPERWLLSADEVSYYFALGHAMRPRFAKDADEGADSATMSES